MPDQKPDYLDDVHAEPWTGPGEPIWDTDNTSSDGGQQLPGYDEEIPEQTIRVMVPTQTEQGSKIKFRDLDEYECLRCKCVQKGHITTDGAIKEPHTCEGCDRQGPFRNLIAEHAPNGNPSMLNDVFWMMPSNIDHDIHETWNNDPLDGLWDDVYQYIYDHWVVEWDEEWRYAGLTAWAISTWVRPCLDELAHLIIGGKFHGGKSQLLKTMKRLTYRGGVFSSAKPAAVYRSAELYGATFMLSEYHRLPQDEQHIFDTLLMGSYNRDEDHLMNTEKGGDWAPTNFSIFSHMGIATQYNAEEDIESRSIHIHTSKPTREVPDSFDEERATDIRNRLLYLRYRLLGPRWDEHYSRRHRASNTWRTAEQHASEWLENHGVKHRTKDILRGMTTIAAIFGKLDTDEYTRFVTDTRQHIKKLEASSTDAIVIGAIQDVAFEQMADLDNVVGNPWGALKLRYCDIIEHYNQLTGEDRSSPWLGHIVSRHNFETIRTTTKQDGQRWNGTHIADPELEKKLRKAVEDVGLEWQDSLERAGLTKPASDGETDPRHWIHRVLLEEFSSGDTVTTEAVLEKLWETPADLDVGMATPKMNVRRALERVADSTHGPALEKHGDSPGQYTLL